jgi:hypothetical protein
VDCFDFLEKSLQALLPHLGEDFLPFWFLFYR